MRWSQIILESDRKTLAITEPYSAYVQVCMCVYVYVCVMCVCAGEVVQG